MNQFFSVNLNTVRSRIAASTDEKFRRAEAQNIVESILLPYKRGFMTEGMIDRFLAIDPPQLRIPSAFDTIIDEIERAYVMGLHFSALSSAVVTIERALNDARIGIHRYKTPKIKKLLTKGPLNEWEGNIAALEHWGYLPAGLPQELRSLYALRCSYLHSGQLGTLEADSLRTINGAYNLLGALLGFPPPLFEMGAQIRCLNHDDPLFKVFYAPNLSGTPEG